MQSIRRDAEVTLPNLLGAIIAINPNIVLIVPTFEYPQRAYVAIASDFS